MSYIYGAPRKARNFNVVYIYRPTFGNAESRLLHNLVHNISTLYIAEWFPLYQLRVNTLPATKVAVISYECISVISLEKYCAVSLVLHLVHGLECLGHKPLAYYLLTGSWLNGPYIVSDLCINTTKKLAEVRIHSADILLFDALVLLKTQSGDVSFAKQACVLSRNEIRES